MKRKAEAKEEITKYLNNPSMLPLSLNVGSNAAGGKMARTKPSALRWGAG